MATHQQTQRWVLIEVMEIGHQGEVANSPALHHPGDGVPNPLRVPFHPKEVKGYVQAIGGV